MGGVIEPGRGQALEGAMDARSGDQRDRDEEGDDLRVDFKNTDELCKLREPPRDNYLTLQEAADLDFYGSPTRWRALRHHTVSYDGPTVRRCTRRRSKSLGRRRVIPDVPAPAPPGPSMQP